MSANFRAPATFLLSRYVAAYKGGVWRVLLM